MSTANLVERSAREIRAHCLMTIDAREQFLGSKSPRRLLREDLLVDATYLAAFLMPARWAVWWGCVSIDLAKDDKARFRSHPEALARVVSWVVNPTEQDRAGAFRFAREISYGNPHGALSKAASFGLDEQGRDNPAPHRFRAHRAAGYVVRTCGADGRLPNFLAIGLKMLEGEHGWTVDEEGTGDE